MRPTLFSLSLGAQNYGIHTYGLAVALGLALGLTVAGRQANRAGLPRARFLDLAFWVVAFGVMAARALYVLLNWHGFRIACAGPGWPRPLRQVLYDCTYAFRFWEGGLVFYGGVVGAAGVLVYFSRKHGWSLAGLADLFAPGLPLGHALGRLGCLAAGCCFGRPSQAPWAVAFLPGSVAFRELATRGLIDDATGRTVPLHPTQLYESLAELAIFGLLILAQRRWDRARRSGEDGAAGVEQTADAVGEPAPRGGDGAAPKTRQKLTKGRLFALYLALYAPVRFAVEIFRGDAERRFVWAFRTPSLAKALGFSPDEPLMLSTSQAVSLAIFAAVGAWWWRASKRTGLAARP
jgi:phosphatidylglycerol:prolipoprotein diacylglycerol transferase